MVVQEKKEKIEFDFTSRSKQQSKEKVKPMTRNSSPTWEKSQKTFAEILTEIAVNIWQNWLTWVGADIQSERESAISVNEERQEIAPTPSKIASNEAQLRLEFAEKERSLQQQLAAKDALVSDLQRRLAHQQALAREKETIASAKEQQLEIKDWMIRDFQNRLTLQYQLNEQSAANENTLKQKLDRQGLMLAELQQKIGELQSASSIGSWQLNKWRSRTYCS